MQIRFDSTASAPPAEKPESAAPSPKPQSSVRVTAPSQSGTGVSAQDSAPTGILESNVTFRRDANGQIYYVVTDAKSGKELREFPPAEVRKVGEGIAEYLKQEEAKNTPHIEVKA